MAVLDCMLLNAMNMWNVSAKKVDGREEIPRFKFIHCVAEELLHYETQQLCLPKQWNTNRRRRRQTSVDEDEMMQDERHDLLHGHQCPSPDEVVKTKGGSKRCLVCGLEMHFYARVVQERRKKEKDDDDNQRANPRIKRPRYEGLRKSIYTCNICGISAHYTALDAGV
jgi:hypothetical protein